VDDERLAVEALPAGREHEQRPVVDRQVLRRRLGGVGDAQPPPLGSVLEFERLQRVVVGRLVADLGACDERRGRLGAAPERDRSELVRRGLPAPDGVLGRVRRGRIGRGLRTELRVLRRRRPLL
jgi:hypothetical protein